MWCSNLVSVSSVVAIVLQEFVAPVAEALVAVTGLLAVGAGVVLEPVDEQILVFLQNQKLERRNQTRTNQVKYNQLGISQQFNTCNGYRSVSIR